MQQANINLARSLQIDARLHGDNTKYGLTRFSDYTSEEMRRLAGSARPPAVDSAVDSISVVRSGAPQCFSCDSCNGTVPSAFDWCESTFCSPLL